MEIGPIILAIGVVGYLTYSRSPHNHFYLFDASLKKSDLPNIDVAKLSKEFPDRVQIADEAIKVSAPFRISSGPQGPHINFMKYSDSLFKRDVQIATGIIIGAATFTALSRFANPENGTRKLTMNGINLLPNWSIGLAAACVGLISAFVAGKIFDRVVR